MGKTVTGTEQTSTCLALVNENCGILLGTGTQGCCATLESFSCLWINFVKHLRRLEAGWIRKGGGGSLDVCCASQEDVVLVVRPSTVINARSEAEGREPNIQ